MTTRHDANGWAAAAVMMTVAAAPAPAAISNEDLAKLAQNPVARMISLPFQNNTNLHYGPQAGTQNILNIQPVIPVPLNHDWNLITRTVMPVMWMPALGPERGDTTGIGDTMFTAFLSPAKPRGGVWGVGPAVQLPTNTSRELGNKNWGLGPSFVLLHVAHDSPWVYGVLVNNVWSLGHDRQGGYYNNGLIQGFLNYNFKDGLYLTSSPILTVDWTAASGQRWVLPVGGGIGKIFHLGKQPINVQVSAYYNVVTPDNGADWQIRAQVQLLFPE